MVSWASKSDLDQWNVVIKNYAKVCAKTFISSFLSLNCWNSIFPLPKVACMLSNDLLLKTVAVFMIQGRGINPEPSLPASLVCTPLNRIIPKVKMDELLTSGVAAVEGPSKMGNIKNFFESRWCQISLLSLSSSQEEESKQASTPIETFHGGD